MSTITKSELYRWIVVVLAIFFSAQMFFINDYSLFGWQFRYLTIWGLTLSLISGIWMLQLSRGATTTRPDALVATTFVINGIVVFLYWRLYFQDPGLVNGGGEIIWYREYYVHLMGPVFQWIDALFLFGAFRRVIRPLVATYLTVTLYTLWIELFLRTFSSRPQGTVASGLPYPFLNDMLFMSDPDGDQTRLGFYISTFVLTAVFFAAGYVMAWTIRRMRRASTT